MTSHHKINNGTNQRVAPAAISAMLDRRTTGPLAKGCCSTSPTCVIKGVAFYGSTQQQRKPYYSKNFLNTTTVLSILTGQLHGCHRDVRILITLPIRHSQSKKTIPIKLAIAISTNKNHDQYSGNRRTSRQEIYCSRTVRILILSRSVIQVTFRSNSQHISYGKI